MKRVLLAIVILIAGVSVGILAQNWWEQQRNIAEPPPANVLPPDNSEPSKPEDPPTSEIEILPILGTSNRLTGKQWQDMLAWRQKAVQLAAEQKEILYVNGPGQPKRVALTFDDGPDADITPQVLAILKEYKVPATFFFKGNRVLEYRTLVRKIYDEGYLVASHAYSHQELTKMNRADIDRELLATDQAFEKVIGHKSGLLRPPFGEVNGDVLAAAKDDGQNAILWSIDTLDWSQQEPQHIADNVLKNVRAGDIVLLHSREGQEATVQALPIIIAGLREQGFELVDVATMLGVPPYQS